MSVSQGLRWSARQISNGRPRLTGFRPQEVRYVWLPILLLFQTRLMVTVLSQRFSELALFPENISRREFCQIMSDATVSVNIVVRLGRR